jgi:RND superfamily putative drug exporter
VQSLLSSVQPQNSTLYVVAPLGSVSPPSFCAEVTNFSAALRASEIQDLAVPVSPCSVAANYVDAQVDPYLSEIRSTGTEVVNESNAIYSFPAEFLGAWAAPMFSRSSINITYAQLGGPPSGYLAEFVSTLYRNYSASVSPFTQVQRAVQVSASAYFPSGPVLAAILGSTNATTYNGQYANLTALILQPRLGPWLSPAMVRATLEPGDPGTNYVRLYGWDSLPVYLTSSLVSPRGRLFLVEVQFNVSEGYRGTNDFYPAQAATPQVRDLSTRYFGPQAMVTGSGAISYDTQASEGASGAFFSLLFVFLAVAVGLTLRSWIAPLLAISFASLSILLGYFSIFVSAIFVGQISYVVTYTLMAATLGISTDYLVFLLFRYREELTSGLGSSEALERATERSVPTILTSSFIVAVALGSLSFIQGLSTWGPVLFLTILLTGLLLSTLLPAVTSYVGPRLFSGRSLRPPPPVENSPFYRGAASAVRHPARTMLVIALVALPAVAFWFVTPVSYNFSQGIPGSYPSVQAENAIDQAFGGNALYPVFVLVPSPGGFLLPNGSFNTTQLPLLQSAAQDLLSQPAVGGVSGPFAVGENLTTSPGGPSFYLSGGHKALYTLLLKVGPYSSTALQLVRDLRSHPGWLVGGLAASVVDQQTLNDVQYPLLELLLVMLIGVIIGVAFRSSTYPVIALSGVFISIAVTTALLYLVSTFLLHVALLYLIPLILFVLLVALGNDYTVLIFSRIREERIGGSVRESVARGIAKSGVVVTSLGIILAVSLGSLAFQPLSFLEELGIAFFVSLLIDTFVIRIFYFPAMLTLLERRLEGKKEKMTVT